MGQVKRKSVKGHNTQKELAEIDRLFTMLDKDKSLPTFGEHFIYCVIFGIAGNVNLKKMYPKTYLKLSKWVVRHNRMIVAMRTIV
jgi:hypothetical protein